MEKDDLISRAAAIECAIDAMDDWDGGCSPNREEYIRKYFEDLPAIDAIPMWWITEKFLDVLNKDSELSKAVWLVRKAWQKEQEAK